MRVDVDAATLRRGLLHADQPMLSPILALAARAAIWMIVSEAARTRVWHYAHFAVLHRSHFGNFAARVWQKKQASVAKTSVACTDVFPRSSSRT